MLCPGVAPRASGRNFNHRINARTVYTADEDNSFIVTPQLYFQSNHADNAVAASTGETVAMSASQAATSALNSGYDLGGHVILRHKFDRPGRTLSLDLGVDNARKNTNRSLFSLTQTSINPGAQNDTVDAQSHYLSTGRTLSASLVYTEPMSVNSLLQVSYWSWMFWEDVVLRNELKNTLTAGQAAGYNQSIVLWNISLGKKFLADQRGEIKVGVADLLGQNKNVSRAVTESYLEDTRNEALTRYFMVNFTYTLR